MGVRVEIQQQRTHGYYKMELVMTLAQTILLKTNHVCLRISVEIATQEKDVLL